MTHNIWSDHLQAAYSEAMTAALRERLAKLEPKSLGVPNGLGIPDFFIFWSRLTEVQRFAPFPDHAAILQVADVAIAVWRLTGRILEIAELQQILRNLLKEA